jgi:ATP-dependent Clp protease ATP-binding subunit ClpC
MFERYTEHARRLLFYARYEAGQLGSTSIEPEHVLLGLARVGQGVAGRILAASDLSLTGLRSEIKARTTCGEILPTSVEIPFSPETKRVLDAAAQEADRLAHGYIGAEHLLLGLLREEGSPAASILMMHGLHLDEVRTQIVGLLAAEPSTPDFSGDASAAGRLVERIDQLVAELGRLMVRDAEAQRLIGRISLDLIELRGRITGLDS